MSEMSPENQSPVKSSGDELDSRSISSWFDSLLNLFAGFVAGMVSMSLAIALFSTIFGSLTLNSDVFAHLGDIGDFLGGHLSGLALVFLALSFSQQQKVILKEIQDRKLERELIVKQIDEAQHSRQQDRAFQLLNQVTELSKSLSFGVRTGVDQVLEMSGVQNLSDCITIERNIDPEREVQVGRKSLENYVSLCRAYLATSLLDEPGHEDLIDRVKEHILPDNVDQYCHILVSISQQARAEIASYIENGDLSKQHGELLLSYQEKGWEFDISQHSNATWFITARCTEAGMQRKESTADFYDSLNEAVRNILNNIRS